MNISGNVVILAWKNSPCTWSITTSKLLRYLGFLSMSYNVNGNRGGKRDLIICFVFEERKYNQPLFAGNDKPKIFISFIFKYYIFLYKHILLQHKNTYAMYVCISKSNRLGIQNFLFRMVMQSKFTLLKKTRLVSTRADFKTCLPVVPN